MGGARIHTLYVIPWIISMVIRSARDDRLAAPWLSASASRSELDSASSLSLLHSIYGSQVSQLPFSEDSESSLVEAHSDLRPSSSPLAAASRAPSPLPQLRLRPESYTREPRVRAVLYKDLVAPSGVGCGGQPLPARDRGGCSREGAGLGRDQKLHTLDR